MSNKPMPKAGDTVQYRHGVEYPVVYVANKYFVFEDASEEGNCLTKERWETSPNWGMKIPLLERWAVVSSLGNVATLVTYSTQKGAEQKAAAFYGSRVVHLREVED